MNDDDRDLLGCIDEIMRENDCHGISAFGVRRVDIPDVLQKGKDGWQAARVLFDGVTAIALNFQGDSAKEKQLCFLCEAPVDYDSAAGFLAVFTSPLPAPADGKEFVMACRFVCAPCTDASPDPRAFNVVVNDRIGVLIGAHTTRIDPTRMHHTAGHA